MKYNQPARADDGYRSDKIIWNYDKSNDFRNMLTSKVEYLNGIVSDIIQTNTGIDTGVDNFDQTLYRNTFSVFGQSKYVTHSKADTPRKFKNPWFTNACESARIELKSAKHTKNTLTR